jgi:hypothetical protein
MKLLIYTTFTDRSSKWFCEKGADFGSPDVRMIKVPKVALLTGQQRSSLSAGEVWHFI